MECQRRSYWLVSVSLGEPEMKIRDRGLMESVVYGALECPICLAPPIQAVLTPCGHVSE